MVSAGLVACGGDDGTPDEVPPSGDNHTYVISELALPTSPTESTMLGLDIDDRANDGVDNELGMMLASIRTLAPGLALQASLDEQVDQGGIILLANLKAADLGNASGAGLWIYEGTDAQPAPCADAADTVCRHHLAGTGSFDVSPEAITDSLLVGRIVAGTFKGGPGPFTLPLRLSDGPVFDLPLQRAKAEVAVSVNGFGVGSKLGGAISADDVEAVLVPGLHGSFVGMIDADCTGARTPPSCGCTASSPGAAALGLIDGNDDCTPTLAETQALFDSLVTFDVDLNGDTVFDAVSIGVGVSAVKGTFTVPPFP